MKKTLKGRPPPRLTDPWRQVEWSDKEDILSNLESLKPNLKFLRILLYGPVGAGKSSFINSVQRSLLGRNAMSALENTTQSGKSFTQLKRSHKMKKRGGGHYPFLFTDVMGLEVENEAGIHTDDIIKTLQGHIADGYSFHPRASITMDHPKYNPSPTECDKVHCVVGIIPADSISRMDPNVFEKMKMVQKKAAMLNIPQVIVLTKVDNTCPVVSQDLRSIYHSGKIKEKLQECSNRLELDLDHIYPLKNYHKEVTQDSKIDVLILMALRDIARSANKCAEVTKVERELPKPGPPPTQQLEAKIEKKLPKYLPPPTQQLDTMRVNLSKPPPPIQQREAKIEKKLPKYLPPPTQQLDTKRATLPKLPPPIQQRETKMGELSKPIPSPVRPRETKMEKLPKPPPVRPRDKKTQQLAQQLVTKMKNDQSISRSPATQQLGELNEPWRTIQWSDKDKILNDLDNFKPNLEYLKILLYGPVGAGKSCFINSVQKSLLGRNAMCALENTALSGESFTRSIKTHRLKRRGGGRYPFVFCDITGLEATARGGIQTDDIIKVLDGRILDGYTFHPAEPIYMNNRKYNYDPKECDKVHCLVSILPADTISFMDKAVIEKINRVQKKAFEMQIPQVIVLTKVDKACQIVDQDLRKVFHSTKIKEKAHLSSDKLNIALNNIYPVKNYHAEITKDANVDVLILMALRDILNFANDHVLYEVC